MEHVSSRVFSALAALPISFLFIPYAYWRSREEPWFRVFLKPLGLIFFAWVFCLFVPFAIAWLVAFAVILWQSYALKVAVDANRPRHLPERESWRR